MLELLDSKHQIIGSTAYVVASNAHPERVRAAMKAKPAMGDLVQICDGVADNVEIQAAIDTLPAAGGRVILSEGTFTLAASVDVVDYLTLQGQGGRSSILDGSALSAAPVKRASTALATRQTVLRDFGVTAKAGQYGIDGRGFYECTLKHLYIKDASEGVHLSGNDGTAIACYWNLLSRIFCENCTEGIKLTGAYNNGQANHNYIEYCYLDCKSIASSIGVDIDVGASNLVLATHVQKAVTGMKVASNCVSNMIIHPFLETISGEALDLDKDTIVINPSYDGAGTEVSDWSKVPFYVGRDSSGDWDLRFGSSAYEAEALFYRERVGHRTSDGTLTSSSSGLTETNLGATGTITRNLPATADKGTWYEFVVMVAQQLRIDPGANSAIYINGAKQTDNKYIWADAIGASIKLINDGNGDWVSLFTQGTWGVEA
uniref:Putative pectate lyase n=1 Tax=viral metagenome TaxID=1070528 RepID=A0A6M3J2D2_9ZZZZ